jgi:hypothetical protein
MSFSEMSVEPENNATRSIHQFMWMERLTTPATTVTYSMEFASPDNTTTVHMRRASSLAIKLADLQAGDFAYDSNTDNNSPVASSGFTDGASIVIGDGTSDWLVFFTSYWLIDDTADDYRMQIDVGGTARCFCEEEGENAANTITWGGCTVLEALASSTTVKVQLQTASDVHDSTNSKIFAIRLDAFEDFMATYSDGVQATAILNTTVEVDTVTKNPVVTANNQVEWCAVGGSFSNNADNTAGLQWNLSYQIAAEGENVLCGTVTDNSADWKGHGNQISNLPWVGWGEVPNVDNGEALTIVQDSREDVDNDPVYTVDDSCCCAFTWELAPASGIVIPVPLGPIR